MDWDRGVIVEHEEQGRTSPTPPGPRSRRGRRPLVATAAIALVAAATGAAAALAVVAGTTGFSRSTVERRYVAATVPIAAQPADVGAILAHALPSVVAITASWQVSNPFFSGDEQTVSASGTGVVVSADGDIVTNAHVVSGAAAISISLDGDSTRYPAELVGSDVARDLALVHLEATGISLAPATFATSAAAVGDGVVAVGYALGLSGGPTVTAGIVSATGRTVTTRTSDGTPITLSDMLQTDAAISSGNSGGPLVSSSGQVVGISTVVAASTTTSTATDIGFAIPAATIVGDLADLRGQSD